MELLHAASRGLREPSIRVAGKEVPRRLAEGNEVGAKEGEYSSR